MHLGCSFPYRLHSEFRHDTAGKLRDKYYGTLDEVTLAWNGLTNVQRVLVSVTAVHVAVWTLWKLPMPTARRFVERCVANPNSNSNFPMQAALWNGASIPARTLSLTLTPPT
jgi:hypothetical protein